MKRIDIQRRIRFLQRELVGLSMNLHPGCSERYRSLLQAVRAERSSLRCLSNRAALPNR